MDFQARDREDDARTQRELFDLYLRRHDPIDTWDLVDRSAIWVVGEYLRRQAARRPRTSSPRRPSRTERRTAILATFAFIRRDELDDALRIAELLVDDPRDTVAQGGRLDAARGGQAGPERQAAFLDAHAATMPRVMLRYAIEKLDKPTRDRYLAMRTQRR